MKVVKDGEGEKYDAKGHFGCWAMYKLNSGKDTQKINVSMSHFLPEGGGEMSPSPRERVYFVLSGCIAVKGKAEEHVLEPGDLIYIAPGEERAIEVIGTEPASTLVIVGLVD
jgi:mannose-6-phosphate isomerase-like protein (cupin superfamily)